MINFRKMQETLELIARDGDERSKAIAAGALRRPVMACPACGAEIPVPTNSELRRAAEQKAREREAQSGGAMAEPAQEPAEEPAEGPAEAAGIDSDTAR